MSRPLHTIRHCDAVPVTNGPPLSQEVRNPGSGTASVFVGELASTGPAVWNTPRGGRPTQAQVDAGLEPQIYTRLQFKVSEVYYGSGKVDTGALYIGAGQIGSDLMQADDCWTDAPAVGRSFLVWVNATPIIAAGHPGWLIGELNAVQGGMAHLLGASPQPLP